jgi:hypothetical protein
MVWGIGSVHTLNNWESKSHFIWETDSGILSPLWSQVVSTHPSLCGLWSLQHSSGYGPTSGTPSVSGIPKASPGINDSLEHSQDAT